MIDARGLGHIMTCQNDPFATWGIIFACRNCLTLDMEQLSGKNKLVSRDVKGVRDPGLRPLTPVTRIVSVEKLTVTRLCEMAMSFLLEEIEHEAKR